LIWGNQGSGKSWIVRLLAQLKKEKGYRVVILDPDSNKSEWKGLESYHDIEEIADFIRSYVEELKARYKAFSSSDISEDEWRAKLWQEGKALAIICEEVTTYTDLIDDRKLLTQFFRLGLTKSRKQEMPLTLVSHNNTQKALGNIEGLSNLIEKMLQLELQTDIDPETLQPVASGRGAVKLDGSTHWLPVTLPKLERKITQFDGDRPPLAEPSEPSEPSEPTEPSSEKLAEPTEPSSEKLAEPTEAERLNALLNKQFSGSAEPEPPITEPLNLDPFVPGITNQERGAVVSLRRANASIMTILYLVWSAKKGGNKAYQAARAKLDQILKEAGLS
jgi:energy-coupling factor transporter ATP-binding protein EcfA2